MLKTLCVSDIFRHHFGNKAFRSLNESFRSVAKFIASERVSIKDFTIFDELGFSLGDIILDVFCHSAYFFFISFLWKASQIH